MGHSNSCSCDAAQHTFQDSSEGPKPTLNLDTWMPWARAATKCPSSWNATIAASTPIACAVELGPETSKPVPAVAAHCGYGCH